MSDAMQSSYHGIAARLDRMPITGFHKKILWLLAGITFCDSVDMAVGGLSVWFSSPPMMLQAISG